MAWGWCTRTPFPRNTFVSENVRHTPAFYTPGYGASEFVCGHGAVNTLTDAHALAVLVFQTLSLVHPLLGDAVDEGEPELQKRALAGDEAFPWVDHPEDRCNPAS